LRRLDQDSDGVAGAEREPLGAVACDCGDDLLAADVDDDLGHDRPGRDALHSAAELVPRAELHGLLLGRVHVRARGRRRVPVALNAATALPPFSRSSRSEDAAVASAVIGPIRTRTRLPTCTTEWMSPLMTLRAELASW